MARESSNYILYSVYISAILCLSIILSILYFSFWVFIVTLLVYAVLSISRDLIYPKLEIRLDDFWKDENLEDSTERVVNNIGARNPIVYRTSEMDKGYHIAQILSSDIIAIGRHSNNKEELGTIAHEIAHVKQSNLPHIFYILSIPTLFAFSYALAESITVYFFALPIFAFPIISIIYLRHLRRRELRADLRAAMYVGPQYYIKTIPNPEIHKKSNLFSTRPTNGERRRYIKTAVQDIRETNGKNVCND